MKESLSRSHPELVSLWDFEKNGDLTPDNVSKGQNTKVYWKCDAELDHRWYKNIKTQVTSPECPFCKGSRPSALNCLATKFPHLVKEWYQPLNGDLTPYNVTGASAKKVYWKCDVGPDHIWETYIFARTKNKNECAICDGRKAVESNCLATLYPAVAKQWHPYLNGDLKAHNVTPMSGRHIWWQCDEHPTHIWKSMVWHRVAGRRDKTGTGCPYCANQAVNDSNSLATVRPDLAKEWYQLLNVDITIDDVPAGGTYKAWWKCDVAADHIWRTSITHRISGESNCPCCFGRKVVKSNCLSTTHPEIALEWHPTKNDDLTPDKVTYATNKSVWWQCSRFPQHAWKTAIYHRTGECSQCPYCDGSKGEKAVEKILEKYGSDFKKGHHIKECKDIRSLPFDFVVFDQGNIKFLVEYQGRQHYEPVDYFGGIEGFELTQKHDAIKLQYCIDHNITLLVIPYWEYDDIEIKINKFL